VPAHLPLHSQRLVVVTGKGGVGKTAVAAALARAAARAHRRVLAVEIGAGQGEAVSALLAGRGFAVADGPLRDLAGRPRVVMARKGT